MTKKRSLLKGFGKTTAGSGIFDIIFNSGEGIQAIANAVMGMPMKDGGRVKGVGKAKRGFGRAMRKR
jgi:hypothetical protein